MTKRFLLLIFCIHLYLIFNCWMFHWKIRKLRFIVRSLLYICLNVSENCFLFVQTLIWLQDSMNLFQTVPFLWFLVRVQLFQAIGVLRIIVTSVHIKESFPSHLFDYLIDFRISFRWYWNFFCEYSNGVSITPMNLKVVCSTIKEQNLLLQCNFCS